MSAPIRSLDQARDALESLHMSLDSIPDDLFLHENEQEEQYVAPPAPELTLHVNLNAAPKLSQKERKRLAREERERQRLADELLKKDMEKERELSAGKAQEVNSTPMETSTSKSTSLTTTNRVITIGEANPAQLSYVARREKNAIALPAVPVPNVKFNIRACSTIQDKERQHLRATYGNRIEFGMFDYVGTSKRWFSDSQIVSAYLLDHADTTNMGAYCDLHLNIPRDYPYRSKVAVHEVRSNSSVYTKVVERAVFEFIQNLPYGQCMVQEVITVATAALKEAIASGDTSGAEVAAEDRMRAALAVSSDLSIEKIVEIGGGDKRVEEDASVNADESTATADGRLVADASEDSDGDDGDAGETLPPVATLTVYTPKNTPFLLYHNVVAFGTRAVVVDGAAGKFFEFDCMTRRWRDLDESGELAKTMGTLVGAQAARYGPLTLLCGGAPEYNRFGGHNRQGLIYMLDTDREKVYRVSCPTPHMTTRMEFTRGTATVIGKRLYMIGGVSRASANGVGGIRVALLPSVDAVRRHKRQQVHVEDICYPPTLPLIYGHSAVLIGNNRILVFGGVVDCMQSSRLYLFDTEAKTWSEIEVVGDYTPVPRVEHSMTRVHHLVYVIGGRTFGDTYVDHMDIFNLITRRWHQQRLVGAAFGGIHGHGAVATGSSLYVLGGSRLRPHSKQYEKNVPYSKKVALEVIDHRRVYVVSIGPERAPLPRAQLASYLGDMLETGLHHDIEVTLESNVRRLHKIMLHARCPRLLELARVGEPVRLDAPDAAAADKEEAWRAVLRYVYTNEVEHMYKAGTRVSKDAPRTALTRDAAAVLALDTLAAWLDTIHDYVSADTNSALKMSTPPVSPQKHAASIGIALQKSLCAEAAIVSDYADLLFVVGDGSDGEEPCRMPAHRLFVTRSPHFDKVLSSGMLEAQSGEIRVDDANRSVFASILTFLYTERLKLSSAQDALELLVLAARYEMYDMLALLARVVEEFYDFSSLESVINLVELAEAYQVESLLNTCKYHLKVGDWRRSQISQLLTELDVNASVKNLILNKWFR